MNQIGIGQNHSNRMAQKADIGSKRLISLVPDAWLQWVKGLQPRVKGKFIEFNYPSLGFSSIKPIATN